MPTDPFRVPTPGAINFSGGRTSAFMLWKILEAYDGQLPADLHVIFCNTGKERPETLDFVQECSTRWSVSIVWLEFDPEAEHETRIVNHNSASRNGEPFAALIEKRGFLPNPVSRFCTTELKIRPTKRYMHKICGHSHWVANNGLRADERHRVARLSANNRDRWDTEAPLAVAGMTKEDVGTFWASQPFDLRLPNINNSTPHGNCDMCFLKSRKTIESLMFEDPKAAQWWVEQEETPRTGKPSGAKFRADRDPYAAILDAVQRQQVFDFGDESSMDCFCTD